MDINTKLKATNLGKIAGKSVQIIEKVADTTTTTTVLRTELGLTRKEAKVYVWRLCKYGILKRDSFGLLTLTDTGILYYTKLKGNRRLTDGIQKVNTWYTDRITKIEELRLDKWIELKDPTKIQQVVVGVLVRNFNETGKTGKARPFVFLKDLEDTAREGGIPEEDLIEAIRELNKQGFVSIYPQNKWSPNVKISLYKDFIGWLQLGT